MKYLYDPSGNVAVRKVSVSLAPQITGQLVKQVATPGDIVTFSVVVADAHEVTFQWKFNGADIPGAAGDSLLLPNVSAANEGQYSVVITNSVGSVTNAPAELLLHRGPTVNAATPLRLTAYSGAGGLVTVTPMKLNFDLGETVTLTAMPFAPAVFAGWAGGLNGTANPATLAMDRNRTVRARFASAVPIPSGVIALWRGETDASDLIGGHHGAFFAGAVATTPSVTADGKVGAAFNFDGTVHVRIPDSAALRPAQLTVEAWVFPAAANSNPQTIIARGSFVNTWNLRLVDNRPQFWSHGGQGLSGPSPIPLNQWTHLAITFDGAIKRLFVNGKEVASILRPGALFYDAARVPVTIGSDWTSNAGGSPFNGRIDEIAFYNRALTAEEVFGIYNADFLGKDFSQPYFTSPLQLPDGVLGAPYSQQLTTILGTPPVRFSVMEWLLPQGMTLSPDGLLSGVPGVLGTFVFSAGATDAAGQVVEQFCIFQVF
jgi:hypothetical protein